MTPFLRSVLPLATILVALVAPLPLMAQDSLAEILDDDTDFQEIVEKIRGEKFEKDVPASIQSKEDFALFVKKTFDEEMPIERVQGWEKSLKMLRLLPEDFNLREGLEEFVVTQAGAYYDPDTEAFYVVMADVPKSAMRTMVVHELQHALQDQLFDLDGMLEGARELENTDRESALSFMVEGEATFVMMLDEFQKMGMDPAQGGGPAMEMSLGLIRKMDMKSMGAMGEAFGQTPGGEGGALDDAMEALANMPRFIVRSFMDPYFWGAYAVAKVHGKKGWEGVSDLFRNPPASTELLMHPKKLLRGDDPPIDVSVPDVSSGLGPRWKRVFQDTFGEHGILILLDELLGEGDGEAPSGAEALAKAMSGDASPGEQAAAGWGGDRYGLFEDDRGETVLAWVTTWDRERDAAEFFEAFQEAVRAKFGPTTSVPSGEARFREVTRSDLETENVLGALRGNDVTILIAPAFLDGMAVLDLLMESSGRGK